MSTQIHLAADLGAESGRIIAGHWDGQKLETEEIHRFPNQPIQDSKSLRWNIHALHEEILKGIGIAGTRFGSRVRSVGIDTWGVDYVLLSRSQELLGLPYHYRDPRTGGVMERFFATMPRGEIFAATGLQFMGINTLYQLVACREQEPELLEKAATLLMIPDYLHWKLSGECRAEFTNASTTQCFDPSTGDWAWPLIERAGLPRHLFPRIERPGARLGPLRSDIALPCGLSAAEVILPATHDTGSAVAAVPTEHTGKATWAYISSGTWSLMGVEVNKPALSPGVLAENLTNEGGVDGTFRLLKNIMGMWLVQQCRKSFERQGRPLTYPELAALAQEAPPMRSLVDPDHPSFLSPADMPTAIRDRCRETGQPVPDTEGSLIRCALESLAMKYAQTLSALERATGQKISVVHIVGGGSQNELLNQWTANACGVPVLAGPVEATALGNLLIQVRSTGAIGSLTELREVVRNSTQPKLFLPARSGLPSQPPS